MANNGAIIPLYLNNDLINNLYTIIIQEFTEVNTITTKSQQTVKITTPLSNVTCGQYIQGNFTVELLNEFSKQRSEISKNIVVLLDLRKLLFEYNLLKNIKDKQTLDNIQENDFIEFTSKLNKSPVIQQVEDIINAMEMELTFNPYNKKTSDNNDDEEKKAVLKGLKEKMEEYKSSKCFRFVAEDICNTNTKILVPTELKFMEDHVDYIKNAKVSVLGKVVKIENEAQSRNKHILSGSCFDCLDEGYFKNFKNRFLKNNSLLREYSTNMTNINSRMIEILPIAMYV
ncbi:DUF6414 family protein [Clostridium ganghwense]|uniref:Uncharacterized protein n=1 Tax=Clostridium ganghwense TaxID=312089 RepID=A0ABT4CR90_9CLOT|nr:hypothetical protein [Clostridium ganghwense]MCY6371448.1 hypothetical protein [Clostridium ganghwense]